MKTLTAIHRDGTRFLLMIVPAAFDTQAWANKRAASLALLGIIEVVEEER